MLSRVRRRKQQAAPAAPRELHFGPNYAGNPYQRMLYGALGDVDAVAVPVKDITKHLGEQAASGTPGLFHLHWTNPILQPAETITEARERLAEFTAQLEAFTEAGGTLVWTIHNVLPHDAKFVDLEVELARTILRHAERVHLLAEQTIDQAARHYRIDPGKAVVIELSSYYGVYPNTISREAARARLGVAPGDKALLVAGYIRPYKGIDRMLDVLDELLVADPSLRLLIAGKPLDADAVADLEKRCAEHPRVISRFERIPDEELQIWYGAADVAVLPYTNILNSAAFRLATSLGTPAVAPRMGALSQFEGRPYVRLFDPYSQDDLRDVVRAAVAKFAGTFHLRKAAVQDAAAHAPHVMAAEFAEFIEPLLPVDSPTANSGTAAPEPEFDQK